MMQKTTLLAILVLMLTAATAQQTPSEQIIKKGISLFDEEKYEEALKMYRLVHENDSNYTFMLAEMAMCYLQMEKYDSAIIVADKGLAIPNSNQQHMMRTKGTAYDYSNRPEKAIEVYNQAITRYPYSHQLHFNLGITYLKQNDYANAVKRFQEALRCNPFHASSHLHLGITMARQELYTKALLSLETFLALEPATKRSNEVLVYIENIASGISDTTKGKFIEPFVDNTNFDEVDQLIKSKVALSERYKAAIDFKANIVKQTQLMLESLPFESNSNDFWVQLYFPFFKAIKDGKHIKPFLFTMLRSTGRESVVKYNKKNEKALKAFYSTGSNLSRFRESRTLNIDGKDVTFSCKYYESGNLYSIGNTNAQGEDHGLWQLFYGNGEPMSKGYLINGKKDGEWRYYHDNGLLKIVESYKDGQLHGEFNMFHPTNTPSLKVNYVNNEAEGEVKWFDAFGLLQQVNVFEKGKRNGPAKYFYTNSQVKNEFNFKDNNLHGEYFEYHTNGKLASKSNFVEGKREGEYLEYFVDGKISLKGSFKAGDEVGEWIYYHLNGKVKKVANFSEGKAVGIVKKFYYNGKPESIVNFNNLGNLHGTSTYFNHRGQKIIVEEYNNDILVRVASIDRNGKEFSVSGKPDGTFEFTTYSALGTKKATGAFKKGIRTGTWTFYYYNGTPSEVNVYKDGKLQGEQRTYYPNGQLKNIYTYKDGVLEGLYTGYTIGNVLKSTGYYRNGNQDNVWNYFLSTGSLEHSNYLIDGEAKGWNYVYSVDGKPRMRTKYLDGAIVQHQCYDPNGEIISDINFVETTHYEMKSAKDFVAAESKIIGGKYNGTFTWYHPSGKVLSQKNIVEGDDEGEYKRFYQNGSLYITGFFSNDMKTGIWTSYYEGGGVNYTENYYQNMKDSIHITYYENGKVRLTESYFAGEQDGDETHYDLNGELMVKKIFIEDEIIGYQYKKGNVLCDTILITNGSQPIIAYYGNGTKSYEQQFEKFVPHGYEIKYYSDGSIRQRREYKNGEQDGKCEDFFPNGKLKKLYYLTHGLYQGEYTEYWENGNVKRIITYLNDQEHGETKHFDSSGKLTRIENFWSGNFIGYKQ